MGRLYTPSFLNCYLYFHDKILFWFLFFSCLELKFTSSLFCCCAAANSKAGNGLKKFLDFRIYFCVLAFAYATFWRQFLLSADFTFI